MSQLPDEYLLSAAREALAQPPHFGYSGDLPLFESWGFTFGQTRDSDVLERSNYRTILRDLIEAAEEISDDADEYVQEVRCSHWAYGWADHIAVRVLQDQDGEITVENLTSVFVTAAEIASALEDYPAYDESDWSELESEEVWAAFDTEWSAMVGRWDEEDGPEPTEEDQERVWEQLNQVETPRPDSIWRDDLAELVMELRQSV